MNWIKILSRSNLFNYICGLIGGIALGMAIEENKNIHSIGIARHEIIRQIEQDYPEVTNTWKNELTNMTSFNTHL